MLKVGLVITMLLGAFAGNAAAEALVWSVSANTGILPGSGQLIQFINGFFTFNPTTGFSPNWNFQIFPPGGVFLSPFPSSCPPASCMISSSFFDPTTQSVHYQTCIQTTVCTPTGILTASRTFDNMVFAFSQTGRPPSSVLQLSLSQPLTDAGGTFPLIPAAPCTPSQPPGCDPNTPGSYIGGFTPGTGTLFLTPITGSVSLAPEPGSVLNVLLGAAVLAARRWRRFA